MQSKKKQENEILIEVKKIGRRLEEFQTSTEGRFVKIDERFDKVDERFTKIDERFVGVDKRFDEVAGQFASVDKRFDEVAGQFASVDKRFDEVNSNIEELASATAREFNEIGERFVAIDQRFDKVDSNLEELAIATAQEFIEVRQEIGEMATKTELHEFKQEIVLAINHVDMHLSATANQWRDDFEVVNNLLRQHDGRIRVLEKLHRSA
jgi:methyl-accepting chemotaxis protein